MIRLMRSVGCWALFMSMLCAVFASFQHWPDGMERFVWMQMGVSATAFLGAIAFGKQPAGKGEGK